MQWSPRVKICFSDEELIQNLVLTHDRPERRTGNWWTFFNQLCRHEQSQLVAQAERRWTSTLLSAAESGSLSYDAGEPAPGCGPNQTIQVLSRILWH